MTGDSSDYKCGNDDCSENITTMVLKFPRCIQSSVMEWDILSIFVKLLPNFKCKSHQRFPFPVCFVAPWEAASREGWWRTWVSVLIKRFWDMMLSWRSPKSQQRWPAKTTCHMTSQATGSMIVMFIELMEVHAGDRSHQQQNEETNRNEIKPIPTSICYCKEEI